MSAPIAVLICMRADDPESLALEAVVSTASSLTSEDGIFLRIDGGCCCNPAAFQAAAAPASLVLQEGEVARGLAYGLNALVDEVLADSYWQLLARMDSDDRSNPGRLERQRRWLETHIDVDILGTACNEVDEKGALITYKAVPLAHRQIVEALPRYNPINHPTVVIRRKVFASGLRYRMNQRRTEDYHLWIDAALAGYRFANLPEPLLDFRRDTQFFRRRRGWHQASADAAVRWRAMVALKLWSPVNVVAILAAFLTRIMPGFIQQYAYRAIRINPRSSDPCQVDSPR
ncbi:MAG: glycosyl transferase [Cyanobacteriota bacterium]|nr:glycosyl transferase [Cyanobacteriota bacterium]